jgi:hypothetical protein
MFDQNYMASLPKNRILAAYQICSDLFAIVGNDIKNASVPRIATLTDDEVKDAQLILEELLGVEIPYNKHAQNNRSLVARLMDDPRASRIALIQKINRQLKIRMLVMHVDEEDTFEKQLLIFFQKEDARRINELLSEVRALVRENSDLSADHKRRLLKIASEFQAELDKPKSSFRVFLDGLVEASEALGEAGQKAKPAFDRHSRKKLWQESTNRGTYKAKAATRSGRRGIIRRSDLSFLPPAPMPRRAAARPWRRPEFRPRLPRVGRLDDLASAARGR